MAQHRQYRTCPDCGANNDFGEPCDCSKWDKPGHDCGPVVVRHDPEARRRFERAVFERRQATEAISLCR